MTLLSVCLRLLSLLSLQGNGPVAMQKLNRVYYPVAHNLTVLVQYPPLLHTPPPPRGILFVTYSPLSLISMYYVISFSFPRV
jgi:hypothetical protein